MRIYFINSSCSNCFDDIFWPVSIATRHGNRRGQANTQNVGGYALSVGAAKNSVGQEVEGAALFLGGAPVLQQLWQFVELRNRRLIVLGLVRAPDRHTPRL